MRLLVIRALPATLLLHAQRAFALPSALIPEGGSIGNCNFTTGDLGFECIPVFIAYVVEFLFAGIGSFCVIAIVWSGYEIALGGAMGGSSDKGKQRLTWAIVGLIVSLLSFAIINFFIASLTA